MFQLVPQLRQATFEVSAGAVLLSVPALEVYWWLVMPLVMGTGASQCKTEGLQPLVHPMM
jgi:hypothetical protein